MEKGVSLASTAAAVPSFEFHLASNKVELRDSVFRTLTKAEEISFSTIDVTRSSMVTPDSFEVKYYNDPLVYMEFYQSPKQFIHERTVYSFLSAVGDIGGFVDAIFLTFGFFMGLYSPGLFARSLAKKTFKVNSQENSRSQDQLHQELASKSVLGVKITKDSLVALLQSYKSLKPFTLSRYAALVIDKCLCCRSLTDSSTRRELRLFDEASARFEKALDIRSLLKT